MGDIAKKVGHALREHGKHIYAEYNKLVKETESRGNTSDAQDPAPDENDTTQWGNQKLTNLCYFDQMRQDFDRLGRTWAGLGGWSPPPVLFQGAGPQTP